MSPELRRSNAPCIEFDRPLGKSQMKYWEWAPAFELDPKQTALLIIDMQNGFIERGHHWKFRWPDSRDSTVDALLSHTEPAGSVYRLLRRVRLALSILLEHGGSARFTTGTTGLHILAVAFLIKVCLWCFN